MLSKIPASKGKGMLNTFFKILAVYEDFPLASFPGMRQFKDAISMKYTTLSKIPINLFKTHLTLQYPLKK